MILPETTKPNTTFKHSSALHGNIMNKIGLHGSANKISKLDVYGGNGKNDTKNVIEKFNDTLSIDLFKDQNDDDNASQSQIFEFNNNNNNNEIKPLKAPRHTILDVSSILDNVDHSEQSSTKSSSSSSSEEEDDEEEDDENKAEKIKSVIPIDNNNNHKRKRESMDSIDKHEYNLLKREKLLNKTGNILDKVEYTIKGLNEEHDILIEKIKKAKEELASIENKKNEQEKELCIIDKKLKNAVVELGDMQECIKESIDEMNLIDNKQKEMRKQRDLFEKDKKDFDIRISELGNMINLYNNNMK